MNRFFVIGFLACTSALAVAGNPDSLLHSRSTEVVTSMNRGLTKVDMSPETARASDSLAVPVDTMPSTSVSGTCNLDTSALQCYTVVDSQCNGVTAVANAQCTTPTSANCQTSSPQCNTGTFPAYCGTQNGAHVSCSNSSCQLKTFVLGNVQCTSAANGCDPTTWANQCQSWTSARYMCQTSTPWCASATLAPACPGTTSPACTDQNTYTRNCVNTVAGGSNCSVVGACQTFGEICVTTSPVDGMCGSYSSAAGNLCVMQSQGSCELLDSAGVIVLMSCFVVSLAAAKVLASFA